MTNRTGNNSNYEIREVSEVADEEANSLIYDTEQSKRKRIEIINSWPTINKFEIEQVYSKKLQTLNIREGFRPVKFDYSNEKYFQRSVAYILDSLDFLPARPDLSFDFIWRAIDFLSRQIVSEQNITVNNDKEIIKACIDNVWAEYFENRSAVKTALMTLIHNIPVQSCEYLFKRLYSEYDTSRPNNPNQQVSRLVGFDGGTVRNPIAKEVIETIKAKYSYTESVSRRKGSRFLYRFIKADSLTLELDKNELSFQADFAQILNFTINGILYTFRNDRAHGGVFSPFRSSKATMRTYAHCKFCFLLGYYLLAALIHFRDSSLIKEEALLNNYNLNIELYRDLFGRNLKR